MRVKRLELCLVSVCLVSCVPSVDVGTGPIVVGPQGGIFVRDGYAMRVPQGALSEETTITVTTTDTGVPEVPERTRVSLGFRFRPSTLTFSVPVTLYLPWIDDRVPQGVDLATFDMRRQAGSDAYLELDGARTTTDPFEAVEAVTDRLGLFWVTSPSQGSYDTLELSPTAVTLERGGTQAFTATVREPTGETVDVAVSWAVAPPRVGSIDADGVFTAKDWGTATVTARAGSLTATATVSVPADTPGPSTFVHQNPLPTGNDLYGGALAPGGLGAVMVGDHGTVLARTSGAWSRLFSTPGLTLEAVAGTTQDDAIAVGKAGTSGVLVEFRGTSPPRVTVFPPTQISELNALWFDGTTGMAVGTGNDVLIRRGSEWQAEYHPSFEKLLSVKGDGAGGFVVVGDLGSLYRWDPARRVWDSLYQTRLAVKLDAATVVDAATGESWAVGGNRLWHFVPGGWTAEAFPAEPAVRRSTAVALFGGLIVMGVQLELSDPLPPARGALLMRTSGAALDGGSPAWTWQPLRDLQVPRGLFGSGATGYAVGDLGAVWEWSAQERRFRELSSGFYADVASLTVTGEGVFAAVNGCATLRCQGGQGAVLRSTDGGWEPLGELPEGTLTRSITGDGASTLAVATSRGVVTWTGSAWVPVSGGTALVRGLATCPDRLYAVGDQATFLAGSVLALNPAATLSSSTTLFASHCPAAGEVWVAGNGLLGRRTGNGGVNAVTSESIRQGAWRAVFSPAPGEGFAFGDARYGVYFNTAELSVQDAFVGFVPDVVTAVWGRSIDTMYMVGVTQLPLAYGMAARFNGVDWTQVDSGAHRLVTSIAGPGTDRLFLGTLGGGILKASPP